MLMPRNPGDDDVLWSALRDALPQSHDFRVIAGGTAVAVPGAPWTTDAVDTLIAGLRACPLRYIGARHGQPLGPHFAVTEAGDEARLVELVCMRFRGDGDTPAMRELIHDVGVVAVTVSVARPALKVLRVPLRLEAVGTDLPDGFVVDDRGTTVDLTKV